MTQLVRDEIIHFSVSIIIAIVFANAFNEPSIPFIGALLGGFFIDADHLFDHWIVLGFKKFKVKDFLAGKSFKKSKKIYVILHGWEYPLLLSFLTYSYVQNKALAAFIISFAVSQLFHLIIDTFTNHVTAPGYSIVYRLLQNFDQDKISRSKK